MNETPDFEEYDEDLTEPVGITSTKDLDWAELRVVGLRYTKRYNLSFGEAEDTVQICLMRLVAMNEMPERPYGMMRTMVSNACIDFLRSGYHSHHADGSLPEPGDIQWRQARTVMTQELKYLKPGSPLKYIVSQDSIRQVLEFVSERHRPLFLEYLSGATSQELAQTYGYASARSVNQTLTRIKNDLREEFKDPELFRV